VSDKRHHRGPHPEDELLFAAANWSTLQQAVDHLCWLLTRNYAWESALKLVGDRFRLNARQRLAVQRSACADQSLARRWQTRLPPVALTGQRLSIDGLNLLTTIEAALAGGVVLRARDGCLRDMASVHGTYRKVAETEPAIRAVGTFLRTTPPALCTWWLDRPVSNSGRLGQMLKAVASAEDWPWQVELVADPDRELRVTRDIVATADSVILDTCHAWVNLAAEVIGCLVPRTPIVMMDLTSLPDPGASDA